MTKSHHFSFHPSSKQEAEAGRIRGSISHKAARCAGLRAIRQLWHCFLGRLISRKALPILVMNRPVFNGPEIVHISFFDDLA